MFHRMKLAHTGSAEHTHPTIEVIGHALAYGLGVPIVFAIIGGLINGFTSAMIGFALGLATCVVVALILTVSTSE